MTDARIMLAGGTLFDILDPENSVFTIGDIAHGLARVCRFAGHTSHFYSVAEHSVHVARLVDPRLGRAALLHDASEAFIGDVTRPLKALLPDYRAIEDRINVAIADRFLGDQPESLTHPSIKAADIVMAMVEARALMPEAEGFWIAQKQEVKALYPDTWQRAKHTRISCDKPEFATSAWLRAWHRYGHIEAQRAVDEREYV